VTGGCARSDSGAGHHRGMRYDATAPNAIEAEGPVAAATVRSLLWALGIFVVFAPLAVRAYRRRT